MAIDTAMKRFSMLNMASPVYVRLFQPDGAVDADDRAYLLRIYGGIALDAPPVPSVFVPAPTIRAALQVIQSYLLASGYYSTVQIGEPKDIAEGAGMMAAIDHRGTQIVLIMAGGATLKAHEVNIHVYRNMMADPTETIEFELAAAISNIGEDLLGDYNLGDTVKNIDAGGMHNPSLRVRWGHAVIANKAYRVATMTFYLEISDTVTAAA